MEDDDWNMSTEELDRLERNAAAEIASRKSSSIAPCAYADLGSPNKINNFRGGPSSSPLKNIANGCSSSRPVTSPFKSPGKGLNVRIFKDQGARIAVECPFNQNMLTALRSISGKYWEVQRKVWTYPESELDALVRAISSLSHLQIHLNIEPPLAGSRPVERNLFQAETEIFSTPPEASSDVFCTPPQVSSTPPQAPSPHVTGPQGKQPSEDGDWRNPKSSKSSQDSAPSKPPVGKCTVTLSLDSSGKVAAKFEYDSEMVAAFRRIPKSEWHAKTRLWMFPFSVLSEAEEIIKNVSNRSVRVEPLPPLVKRAIEATAALPDLTERYDFVPPVLKRTLMDFQQEGVKFALQHGGRALIADEMGLGKTLQALAVVACLEDDWPVLIVVPSSLRLNWASMVQKWLQIEPSDITVVMSQGSSSRLGFNIVNSSSRQSISLDGQFNIMSYDVLTKLEGVINSAKFKIVIADESHYMKNPNAKRTGACVSILRRAKYALLLTGTPALSRPIELFKQLEALQPSVYKRMEEYGKRYCMGGYFGIYQGSSNHQELHALVKSTVMIRRLKKDVMTQLPKKRREQVFISLDDQGSMRLRSLFLQLESAKTDHRLAIGLSNTKESTRLNFLERQLLSKIYTDSAEAKLPAVEDYLTTILDDGSKFLVFAHHQSMLDGVQELLQKKRIHFIRIDGKTPASARLELVQRFQEDADVKVAVLGIRAAGVGLTFTAASTVIFAEMSWTPGDLAQAEDRVHRIGQESAVNIYYLHAHGSIDDLIWDTVQHKLENLGQVLDGEENGTMKLGSDAQDPSVSSGKEGLDTVLRACENSSRPPKQGTLDGFFQLSQGSDTLDSQPMAETEDVRIADISRRLKRRRESFGSESWAQTGNEIIDLGDDEPEGAPPSFESPV